MRAGRKKFDANASPAFRSIAKINDAAILFFFRSGVDEDHVRTDLKLGLQVKETTVRVDDDRLTGFLKLFSKHVFAGSTHGNPRENAGTAALPAS